MLNIVTLICSRFISSLIRHIPVRLWEPLFLLATGSNENANGLLREFFPKGTDFAQMTDEALCRVLDLISHRPRKCLGWRMKKEAATKGPGNAKPLDAAFFCISTCFAQRIHNNFKPCEAFVSRLAVKAYPSS
ncbi:hypothetical protein CA599_31735 [Paenibacillus taichungensis]|nr:hypothetical protein CA599_31735 [Paenibacillus taichungensis]